MANLSTPILRIEAILLAAAVALLAIGKPAAALAPSEVYYGRGVQAFFDEEWRRSEAYFDRSISLGSAEPRAFYFRGLARRRLGQTEQASADLYQGAALESGRLSKYRLGVALTTIPAEDRQALAAIRAEVLGPASQLGDGADTILRAKFRLPLEAFNNLENPQQLAKLVEATRPGAEPSLGAVADISDPFTDDDLIPEEARGSMSTRQVTGVVGSLADAALRSFSQIFSNASEASGMGPPGNVMPGAAGGPFEGGGFEGGGFEGGGFEGGGFEGGFEEGGFEEGGFEEGGFEEGGFDGEGFGGGFEEDEDPFSDAGEEMDPMDESDPLAEEAAEDDAPEEDSDPFDMEGSSFGGGGIQLQD